MSASTAMNLGALFVAIAALAVSVVFARRQLTSATSASTVQIAIEVLTRETRTDAFMDSEDFVLNHLAANHPPGQGVAKLPHEARRHFHRVAFYYADLGVLLLYGTAQATMIVATMRGPALRAWSVLEPYIRAERAARNSTRYLNFFEHLACVCADTDLVALHDQLGLRSFDATTAPSAAPAKPSATTTKPSAATTEP
jgi:hypothetical protein